MDAEASFSQAALPIFDGENYEFWAVRMETYLEALDLWEVVEEDFEILPLPDNPTMAQLKNHRQKKIRKAKAKSCLFAGVSKTIFTRIMSLKTAREIWNYLKEEYAGDDRIRNMQVLNLIREFELQRMKESETIKEYSDKLLAIANKVRLLGTEFADSRIVQKILVTVPEKYESTITTLENTKDLSNITLAEVLHALKAQEQRRLMRQEGSMENAFQAKLQINNNGKSFSNKPEEENEAIDDEPVRGTRSLSDIYQRCNVAIMEPAGYAEAANDKKWIDAMEEELKMIEKNQTWKLVDRPDHKKAIGVKWVYRTKLNPDGSVNKYKARLVVKGYAQIFGVDFSETFAPVARLDTIRLLFALAAQNGWVIHQMDVKSAFLNGYLEEEIFVEQPEGFIVQGQEEKVYKLNKALYGLKQAPRSWYSRIDAHLVNLGFEKSPSEFTLYVKKVDNGILVVSLYVDDLFVTGSHRELIDKFKERMKDAFEMTDLGNMSFFLGMQVQQRQNEIFVCQQKYAKEVLKKFNMEDCKPVATPMNQKEKFSKEDGAERVDENLYRSLIGCLMYLTATRPDIMYAVSLLSRYMHCASEIHFQAAKRILRYVKGTVDYGIRFNQVQNFRLLGYSDSDWAGCVDDMRSTSGYCFTLGSGVFSWCSKKQEVIAQSTAEAESIAAVAAVNQTLWIRKLMIDLYMEQIESTQIFVDNQAAISIANDPVFHGRTKHFKIKFFLVQKDGDVQLVYCRTEHQNADILTKALPTGRFEFLRKRLGICSFNVKEEC
ncbi:unnamed protein product [Trifolium pratense]|uniref:Uncharacterized protein n=1 Tax=Trifolium pratense TaxID=57577 RepID=A0ACB0I775_TRIPR|nr:unnamed protein product [Trifolium pratense]